MTTGAKAPRRTRSFFETIGRAYRARDEFERLTGMSDKALASMNLTREQIPQYIAQRL
ncbi:MAG: hypothetical protein MJE12_05380 [Alphaproteobacteria bacterium]|nr:hypothetical protein [Alphaproteobacteria bacterium]